MDGQRIGIQVEHAPDPRHHVQKPGGSHQVDTQRQRVRGVRLHFEPANLAVQKKGSAIDAAMNIFHALNGPLGEKVQQCVVVVGRSKA